MDINEYNKLMNNYIASSIRICIEKCCGYKFMFALNNRSKLSDLYNYVVQFYSHVTEPILLYEDSEFTKMIPCNDIFLETYIREKNMLSYTPMEVPVVYKFHLDLCSKHKRIYNQNYMEQNYMEQN